VCGDIGIAITSQRTLNPKRATISHLDYLKLSRSIFDHFQQGCVRRRIFITSNVFRGVAREGVALRSQTEAACVGCYTPAPTADTEVNHVQDPHMFLLNP